MKTNTYNKYHLKEKAIHGTPQLPFSIYHLNHYAHEDNYFSYHWHEEIEWVVLLKGSVLVNIDHMEIPVHEGEGLFINAHKMHSARSLDGDVCEACVVVFHPMLLHFDFQSDVYSKLMYPVLSHRLQTPTLLKPDIKWQKDMIDIIREFDELYMKDLTNMDLLIKGNVFRLWHLLFHNSPRLDNKNSIATNKNNNYKIQRMKPVLLYIHEHYMEQIELEQLAAIIPMSKGQFCRSFKDILGMSPMTYVINYRIQESCQLLLDTNKKIASIANLVGFNNISYFNREFIKRIGKKPSEYRK